ncbi:MAG: hypothetical protein AB7H96_12765 [Vicinamibacterales bacterium]
MTEDERAARDIIGAQLDALIRQMLVDLWPKLEADNLAFGESPSEVVRTYGPCAVIYGGGRRVDVADIMRQEASRLQAWKLSAIEQVVAFAKSLPAAEGRR